MFAAVDSAPTLLHFEGIHSAQHTGYIDLEDAYGSHIFYYFVECEQDPRNAPLVLWLQGGPGCSSMLGNFVEIGPFTVQADATLKANPNAWSKIANVVFIDQPVGTGFSYMNDTRGYVKTLEESTTMLLKALEMFYEKYSWVQNLPFYITGESYAGKYVPALAHRIMTTESKIPLQAVAIGNGWTSPLEQTSVLPGQSYMLGFIDRNEQLHAQELYRQCESLVLSSQWDKATSMCGTIESFIVDAAGGVDINDVRHFGTSLPPYLEAYLNEPNVKASFGVPSDVHFVICDGNVSNALREDQMQSVKFLIPDLLKKYRVVLYNGQFDMNCGVAGTEKYLLSMAWEHAELYRNANKTIWKVDGSVAGYARTVHNLTQLTVVGNGHLIVAEHGLSALHMLQNIITNTPF